MLLLTPILLVPLAAGLLCLLVRSRRVMEGVNVLAFAIALVGDGASLCASGSQVCIGARPALVP